MLTAIIFEEFYAAKNNVIEVAKAPADDAKRIDVYLICGMMNQPRAAFAFAKEWIDSLAGEKGGIYWVNYSNWGFSEEATVLRLREQIRTKDVKVILISISLGERVAMRLETDPRVVKRYVINPCSKPDMLQDQIRKELESKLPTLRLVVGMLGWLAFLPVIPADGGLMSLKLLVDQANQIASTDSNKYEELVRMYDYWEEIVRTAPRFLILSQKDEFLDNRRILATYKGEPVEYVDAQHARTIGADAEKYLQALKRLG